MSVAAVVLAAGAGTRFGGPKQRLLLPSVLAAVAESPVDEVVVVAGAYTLDVESARVVPCLDWERGPGASLRAGLAALGPEAEAAVVVLADGPNLSSAAVERVVTAWADVSGGQAPGHGPNLSPAAVERVATAWADVSGGQAPGHGPATARASEPTSDGTPLGTSAGVSQGLPRGHVLAASYDGTRSHPVLVPRSLWDAVPDEGARSLPAALVDCADIDPPGDVDHADDMGRAATPSREI